MILSLFRHGVAGLAMMLAVPSVDGDNERVYEVNKTVAEFPDGEDLSTPEAAYASLERAYAAEGAAVFKRLSVRRLTERMPAIPRKFLPDDDAQRLLDIRVVEVHVWGQEAVVIAHIAHPKYNAEYDLRWLERVDGRWLNTGNDVAKTLEEARGVLDRVRAYEAAKRLRDERPPVADPAARLRPFVEFLEREGKDPHGYLLDAMAARRIVILGEIHHRSPYMTFNAALVRDPEFTRRVGVIYLELPSHAQPLVDRFLAAPTYDPRPVIDALRDMMLAGWPDQMTVDFFRAVWEVNQTLPEPERLRIGLVDMPRPWKEIHNLEDWVPYEKMDRNQVMAENIVRDLKAHEADPRHALFIVGWAHAMVDFHAPIGTPMKTAGWHLREALGVSNVLAVLPHGPVMTNTGQVSGRRALGLFESAFAARSNQPMAFPLDRGPFGAELFDADPEVITTDPYRQGFGAYLYLGPLEDESFSPLIPDFYSDEFVREVERRVAVTSNQSQVAIWIKDLVARSRLMAELTHVWGQRRREWSADHLGPLNAWTYGSGWEDAMQREHHARAMESKADIQAAAQRLFQAIRTADYDHDWMNTGDWQLFPAEDVDYTVDHDYPVWVRWVCKTFKANPIVEVKLGEVHPGRDDLPTVPFTLRLKDGDVLEGELAFRWNSWSGRWGGWEGLDWHLHDAPK